MSDAALSAVVAMASACVTGLILGAVGSLVLRAFR